MSRFPLPRWLRNLGAWRSSGSAACGARKNPIRLRVEALEDRWVPTTVTNLLDAGPGSLRDAIAATPTGGTIDFQPGLTGAIVLTSGELVVPDTLTITGPGAGSLAISGGAASRIFDLPTSAASLTLSGLTIENGYTSGSGAAGSGNVGWGGGIVSYGSLSIANCVITGNYANFGGGGVDNWGPLNVSNSVFSNNTTDPALGGGGGAIYDSNGVGTIAASSFTNNLGGQGGAIINNSGNLTIDGSTFAQNKGIMGGGVYNAFKTTTVTNSTFVGNTAGTGGVGGYGGALANMSNSGAALTVVGCTLNGNSAGANGGVGGGIYNQDSSLTVSNSTLFGNAAPSGAGIYNVAALGGGAVSIDHSTISGNVATSFGGGVANVFVGPSTAATTMSVFDTIIAGNSVAGSPDVYGPLASLGHNLIGVDAGGSGYASSDLVGAAANPLNPQLAALALNGGPTATMALLAGSPAINAGDNANAPTYDQRGAGFPRIAGSAIDIGAYEVQTLSPAVPTVSVTGGTYAFDGSPHPATATATGSGNVVVSGSFSFTYNGSSTVPTNAGTYAVVATFTSADPAYANASASGTLTIGAVAPSFSNLNVPSVAQGSANVTISGNLAAGSAIPVGDSVSIVVNGVAKTAIVGASGAFSAAFAVGGFIAGNYSVGFSFAGDGGNFSAAANASASLVVTSVSQAPVVTLDPQSQTAVAGQSVTFVAAATGNPAPTVQWQMSRDGGRTFRNIVGATNASLTVVPRASFDGREYRAVFTNPNGAATTHAAVLSVAAPPRVTRQPEDLTVLAGAQATLTAAARGNPVATVQWQVSTDGGKTWTDVAGATSTKLVFTATASQNGFEYRAKFANAAGTAFSEAATLEVFAKSARKGF